MLPGAPAEWSFMERISGLDRGFIFSFSLLDTHIHRDTLSLCPCVGGYVCLCVCVLAVTAVTKLWFHPGRPFAFRPLRAPFQFQSPRGGYKPFWKLLSISNFSAWLPRKKNQLIRKSSPGLPGRLRQGLVNLHLEKVFHTCVGRLSPQGVSAVGKFTVAELLD